MEYSRNSEPGFSGPVHRPECFLPVMSRIANGLLQNVYSARMNTTDKRRPSTSLFSCRPLPKIRRGAPECRSLPVSCWRPSPSLFENMDHVATFLGLTGSLGLGVCVHT